MGHELILWTCREDGDEKKFLTEAVEYCRKRGLEFVAVNDNSPSIDFVNIISRKIYYDILIDDRTFPTYPNNVDWAKVAEFFEISLEGLEEYSGE